MFCVSPVYLCTSMYVCYSKLICTFVAKALEFTAEGGCLTFEVGQTVTLDCSASGSPEPVVTPLNNGLPSNVAFVNDKYVITASDTSNDGLYICQAENSFSVEMLFFDVKFSGDC